MSLGGQRQAAALLGQPVGQRADDRDLEPVEDPDRAEPDQHHPCHGDHGSRSSRAGTVVWIVSMVFVAGLLAMGSAWRRAAGFAFRAVPRPDVSTGATRASSLCRVRWDWLALGAP